MFGFAHMRFTMASTQAQAQAPKFESYESYLQEMGYVDENGFFSDDGLVDFIIRDVATPGTPWEAIFNAICYSSCKEAHTSGYVLDF